VAVAAESPCPAAARWPVHFEWVQADGNPPIALAASSAAAAVAMNRNDDRAKTTRSPAAASPLAWAHRVLHRSAPAAVTTATATAGGASNPANVPLSTAATLAIPARTLTAGLTYAFRVTAAYAATPALQGSAEVRVTVAASDLVARVSGGKTVIAATGAITLDGLSPWDALE